MNKTIIKTDKAPAPVGAYNQGTIASGNIVFTAGQVPIDPSTGKLIEGSFEKQVERVLDNISAVLKEAGTSMKNLVKLTVFMKDLNNFGKVNEVFQRYLGDTAPARSAFQVSRLPLDAEIEVEGIAVLP